MADYTQTYSFTKVDNVDIVEAQDFEDIEAEYALIETAIATKLDETGGTASVVDLTVTTATCGTLDWDNSTWTRVATADSPVTAAVGDRIFCTCDGAITINLPESPATDDIIWVRVDGDVFTNNVTVVPYSGDSVAGQAADATLVIDLAYAQLELVANASDNWDI